MSLDAATLALVAGELKNTLLDAKIDKIFEPTRDEVLMTLRTRTETHRQVKLRNRLLLRLAHC